jgi:polar amino acid transport system substrate-binding protein
MPEQTAMRLSLAGLAFAALLTLGSAKADTIRATTVNWAPYFAENVPKDGFITELARAAFAKEGHEMEVVFQPWRRALAKGRAGAYDAVLAAYKTPDREKDFYFSKPFYAVEIGLMAHADLGLPRFTPLEELDSYLIGYNAGWAYGERFENADYLQKDPANNHTENVRKFFAGRLDIVAMARSMFRFEAAKLDDADLDEVTFLDPPLKIGQLHMMFPKVNDNAKRLRDDFNAGLKAIRADGTYGEIIEELGF